jgi:polygalacturonase
MGTREIILKPNLDSYSDYIQIEINKLSKNSGGKIILLPGIHKSKPIKLESGIHLEFSEGSTLLFSPDFSHYSPVFTRWEGTECYALGAMIFADSACNVKISGKGIIDGQGNFWWKAYRDLRKGIISESVQKIMNILGPLNRDIKAGSGGGGIETNFLRPSLLQVKDCVDVTISDVTLRDSAFWNTHILYSTNVSINGAKFVNPSDAPNTDGLDIDSSSFVTVENCRFDVGDDCLCLKSGMDADGYRVGKSTNNVKVSNCTMNNGHGGIVFGSETSGGINNIDISNCTMNGTDRGIRIKTRRGRCGDIHNLSIKNMAMNNVICPIVVNMYYRCGAKEDDIPYLSSLEEKIVRDDSTPFVRNIEIKDLVATNVKSAGLFFLGLPESPIRNLSLENISITRNPLAIDNFPAMDLFNTQVNQGDIFKKNIDNFKTNNIFIDQNEVFL